MTWVENRAKAREVNNILPTNYISTSDTNRVRTLLILIFTKRFLVFGFAYHGNSTVRLVVISMNQLYLKVETDEDYQIFIVLNELR